MIYVDGRDPLDLGICVRESPVIPTPERDVEYIEIRGRNGSLVKKHAYKDIIIPVVFNLIDRDGIRGKARYIKPWLMNASRLEFEDDPGFYYKVKHGEFGDIEHEMRVFGMFTVDFRCAPFQYHDSGIRTFGKTGTVFNQGTVPALPYIKVYGTGDGAISVSGKTVQLRAVNGYIEMDSEAQSVYKGTVPSGTQMIGDFIALEPGTHTFTLTGGLTGFEINVREAYL